MIGLNQTIKLALLISDLTFGNAHLYEFVEIMPIFAFGLVVPLK